MDLPPDSRTALRDWLTEQLADLLGEPLADVRALADDDDLLGCGLDSIRLMYLQERLRAWLDAGLRPVGAAPLPGGLARPAGLRGPAVRPGNGRAADGAGSRPAVRAVFRAAGLLAGTWRRRGAGQRQLPCLPGIPHAGCRPAAPGRGGGVRASTPPDVAGALPRRSPADPSDAAAVLLRPAGLAHLTGGRGRARLAGAARLARP